MSHSLTPKQLRFCEEYLLDLNATQAAIRAGYSRSCARTQAVRLMRIPSVRAYIDSLIRERSERTEISADRVLREVALLAFANMGDFLSFDSEGHVYWKDSSELSREQLSMISEITVTENKTSRTRKIKMYDKDTALYNLMRHLGLFEKDPRDKAPEENFDRLSMEEKKQLFELLSKAKK